MIGDIEDPHLEESTLNYLTNWQDLPDLEYPDIYNYLIATPSPYTKDQLKAYKSMDGYSFVANGWVNNVKVAPIASQSAKFLVLACVRHSQKLAATPLKPWIAVEKTGSFVCTL